MGIYRVEVLTIMGAIGDLTVNVERTLDDLEAGDDEEEDAEENA